MILVGSSSVAECLQTGWWYTWVLTEIVKERTVSCGRAALFPVSRLKGISALLVLLLAPAPGSRAPPTFWALHARLSWLVLLASVSRLLTRIISILSNSFLLLFLLTSTFERPEARAWKWIGVFNRLLCGCAWNYRVKYPVCTVQSHSAIQHFTDPSLYPGVSLSLSLSMKACAWRKAGRRELIRRVSPSRGPLRFVASHSHFALASVRKTKRPQRRQTSLISLRRAHLIMTNSL